MRKFVLTVGLVLMAGSAQAATLDVVGGQLMGASDVLVDGSLYDVQFLDGSCIDLYNGCHLSDFTFSLNLASAALASQALLDQVFLDGVDGLFDSVPQLTNGCELPSLQCRALTIYSRVNITLPFLYDTVRSYASENDGGVSPNDVIFQQVPSLFTSRDISEFNLFTYAVWSPSAVPEPSTALLLGLGLTGLAAKGRRRNRS